MVLGLSPLILAILTPLIAALLILVSGRFPNLRETFMVAASIILTGIIYYLYNGYIEGNKFEYQLINVFGQVSIGFLLEPLGLIFASLVSILWLATSIYSIGYMRSNNESHQTRFYLFIALTITSAIGLAFAANLLTLYIFYELITLCTYPLVTHGGKNTDKKAGRIYLGMLLAPSFIFILPLMIWIWSETGNLNFMIGGITGLTGLNGDPLTPENYAILLLVTCYGIAKAALMPLHRWLPAAMVAPVPVSALLHAVAVVNAGLFTIIKISIYIFGYENLADAVHLNSLMNLPVYLAGATIIVASIIALRKDNLKARLAYSTISQLSYVIMAATIFTPKAMIAAVFQLVAHGIAKICLFFAAGSIYTISHKSKVSELDGIGKAMPITMLCFMIAAFSMIGLPLTAGFVSKWQLLAGAYEREFIFPIIIILLSTMLNIFYYLPILYRAFFLDNPDHSSIKEAPYPILFGLCFAALLTIGLFYYPDPIIKLAYNLIPQTQDLQTQTLEQDIIHD